MEVRGSVIDRPWGLTLGAIALRGHTGQLTIDSDGKRHAIAFDHGAVVAATSPAAADAIARIALTNHFITSTQVPDITRRLAASPDRDEVDVLAEVIRFTPEQVTKLRHRLVAQRAARTFSLERGDFVLDDRIALPVFPGVSVDHRHVIYLGVRNLSEQRLLDDLRQLGSYFVLKPDAVDELPRFGFEHGAQPVLEALKLGTSLPELEASHRELDPRLAQAVIYALVSCSACVIPQRTQTAAQPVARAATPRNVTARASTRVGRPAPPREPHAPAATARATTGRAQSPPTPPPAAPSSPEPPEPPQMPATGTRQDLPPSDAASPTPARPGGATQSALAAGTSTYPSVATQSGARTTTLPATARTATPPATARTATPPAAARTATSPTSYSGTTSQDPGTNTPAATRPRTVSDTRTARTTTPTPDPSATSPTTPAPARTPTAPPSRAATPSAIQTPPPARSAARTASSLPPPAASRADTDEAGKFTEIPTPSPLPGSAKAPGAATFGERQSPRTTAPTTPAAQRPAISRAMTPSDAEFRGFGEQRTPSGFVEQHTPGFGDQRTPQNQRTPTDPSASRTPTGSPIPSRVSTDNAATAEEAFKRGEAAMKRDQPGEAILEFKTAYDLNPQDVDAAGMLAWAKFCAAGDKAAIGADTRKALERAVYKSLKPERARFYLGRVERMLGRDKEAHRHFQEVLDLKPNHAEAASEIRAIEARMQAAGKTGLFGRKR